MLRNGFENVNVKKCVFWVFFMFFIFVAVVYIWKKSGIKIV